MTNGKLNATIEFSDEAAGSEPLGRMATIALDSAGFRDVSGVGGSGAAPGVLDPARVRDTLLESFGADELRALLDHLVRLRDALSRTGAETP